MNQPMSPVTFHGDTIFCVTHENQPYTPAKPIVENLGLGWPSQSQKLNANKDRWGVTIIVIPTESGDQQTLCIPVRKLPAFLASINPNKVSPTLRPKIELYQNECDDALWNYWTKGQATRQPAAQPALPDTITPSTAADRRPLDKLVKVWAQQSGTVHAQAWTQVNAHFNLDSVTQLPIEWIPDAIAFVEGKINALAKLAAKEEQKALPEAAQLPALSKKDLPSTARLFEDIRKAEKILEGTENWTHIKVRLELCREVDLYAFERSVDMHINAAWYALGLAKSSLLAALTVGRISKEFTPNGTARA